MKLKGLFKNPKIKRLGRIVDLVLLSIIFIHCSFIWQADSKGTDWKNRVFIIDSPLFYKMLNPLAGEALGFALPIGGVAYLNRTRIDEQGVNIDDIITHEAKHLDQSDKLGFLGYLFLDKWKSEGIAEYERGNPTISLCDPQAQGSSEEKMYKEYYIVTLYLIEKLGLSEDSVYSYENYPLKNANDWLLNDYCN